MVRHSGWSGRRLACRAGGEAHSLAHERSVGRLQPPHGVPVAAAKPFAFVVAVGSTRITPGSCMTIVRGRHPDADYGSPGRWVDHQPHWSMVQRRVDRHPASKLSGFVVTVGSTRIAAGFCRGIVRGRRPAAGAGAAAGRLRWVGRERERLRQRPSIDGRGPPSTQRWRCSPDPDRDPAQAPDAGSRTRTMATQEPVTTRVDPEGTPQPARGSATAKPRRVGVGSEAGPRRGSYGGGFRSASDELPGHGADAIHQLDGG